MKSANTVWMWDDEISSDENMYVNRHDYSVWYKGYQIGYMKSDTSYIEPFYEKVYDNLKSFTSPKKKNKERERSFLYRKSYFYFFSAGFRQGR